MRRLYRIALVAAALIWPSLARAADEIHWTIMGPTAVSFDWRGSESAIQFGLTPAYGGSVAAATPDPLPTSSAGPFWEARIVGLLPDTLYHYSIGGGADHTFRTARRAGKADFTAYAEADIGSTTDYWRVGAIQNLIASDPPTLALLVGDLTYGNSNGPASVDQHFNDVMAWSQDVPYMPAWGNHEYEGGVYADDFTNYKGRFDLPHPQPSPNAPQPGGLGEDWYWFDYGNTRFITYPEPFSGAWSDWYLKAFALMDSAQADPNLTFIVTLGHRPAYSSGHHPGSASLKGYLDALGTAHSKYVLNINGHSHDYERTFPQHGVTHITAGGGGANLEEDKIGLCLWRGGCPAPSWSAFRAYHHSAVKLIFSSTTITVQAICGPAGDNGSSTNDVTCTLGSVFDSTTIVVKPPNGVIDTPIGNETIAQGQSIHWSGTATEHDGDNDPLYYTWDFGGGAPPSSVEDPGLVPFTTPGTYVVTFTVRDSEGFRDPTPDTRVITVLSSNNLLPVPVLDLMPRTGNAPLMTVADARGSSDPDGSVVSYAFDFGDGTKYGPDTTRVRAHTYTAGSYTMRLTIKDNRGATSVKTVPVTVAPVQNGTNLAKNASVESDLTGWAGYGGATLQRVTGGFDRTYAMEAHGPATAAVFGINDSPNWVGATAAGGTTYRVTAWVRSAAHAGAARLQIREFAAGVKIGSTGLSVPLTLSPSWQLLTLDFVCQQAGSMLDLQIIDTPAATGEVFMADDVSIRIQGSTTAVDPPGEAVRLAAAIVPNPLHGAATLRLTMPHAGYVRIHVLDLNGRLVRTLMDRPDLAAGAHAVAFDRRDASGHDLGPGLYFCRIETAFGAITRRFAVLK